VEQLRIQDDSTVVLHCGFNKAIGILFALTGKDVDGILQKSIEGISMMYTFDARSANTPSRHHTQYFEMLGARRPRDLS
jgi:hypothetical protein